MTHNRSRSALLAGLVLLAGVAGCADDSATSDTPTPDTTSITDTATTLDKNSTPDTAATLDDNSTPDDTATGVAVDSDGDASEQETELSDEDVAGLLWMREEEQLAHDVYAALGDEWGLRIFDNIARAELRHVDRVEGLLAQFGIYDPMAGQPAGTFTIEEIQQLYDDLVADGSTSAVAALEVGALIEETDIMDLRERASGITDIQTTYDDLEQGSQNHLRAFVSQLDARGTVYRPTVLDQAAYDEIVSER